MLKNTSETFQAAFDRFFNHVVTTVTNEYGRSCPSAKVEMSYEDGRRYIKIVKDFCGRSVYCFVDKTNGDILKAASWKAPAKHARGNIFCDDIASAVTAYGAVYLK